jgi:hypothetical protein
MLTDVTLLAPTVSSCSNLARGPDLSPVPHEPDRNPPAEGRAAGTDGRIINPFNPSELQVQPSHLYINQINCTWSKVGICARR